MPFKDIREANIPLKLLSTHIHRQNVSFRRRFQSFTITQLQGNKHIFNNLTQFQFCEKRRKKI
jgi:hypothetical protein